MRICAADDVACVRDLLCGSVSDHDIFIGLEGRFIFEDAVLRDAHADEASPEHAQAPNDYCTFEGTDEPTDDHR